MNEHSDQQPDWEGQRNRIIGLGETSIRKSYYPELQQRIRELEKKNEELHAAYEELTATDEELRQQIEETGKKEQELRESEERFRSVIEASPVPVALARDGMFIYANSAFCTMTGCGSPKSLIGKSILDFVAPECREKVSEYVRARSSGEETDLFYESVGVRRDGTRFPYEIAVAVIGLHEGTVTIAFITDITDRKAAETALVQSERKFRDIVETTPDLIWEIDGDGNFKYLSPQSHDVLGYSPEDLENKPFFRLLPNEEIPRVQKAFEEHVTGTSPRITFEVIARHSEGHTVVLEIRSSRITDDNGALTGFRGIARDITGQKQAALALARSESRLKRGELIAGVGNWEFHMKTGEVIASEGARKVYGLLGEQWSIADVQETPLPECREMLDEALRGLIEEGRPYDIEFRIRRPSDGTVADIHSVAEYNPEEQVVFGVIQDITERKLAEESVRESEAFLRSIFENIPAMIFVKDARDLRFVRFNRAGEELLGYSRDELIGKSDRDFFPVEQADFYNRKDREVLAGKDLVDIPEEEILTKSHGKRIIHTKKIPILKPDGTPQYLLGISEDITDRKRQEKILTVQLALGLALQEISGMQETLDACLSAAIEISGMDAGGIYLVNPGDGSLHLAFSKNLGDEFIQTASHYQPDSKNARMIMEGKPLYTHYSMTGILHTSDQEEEGLLALGIIPILSERKVIACINIASHSLDEVPAYSRVAVETIATQIGAAIEQKEAEEALRISEERYRALVDTTETGYFVLDNRGRVIDANDVYIRLIGRESLDDLIGHSLNEWTAPHDIERNAREVEKCLKTGNVHGLEVDYIRPDGMIQPVEINATVFHGESGDVLLTLCRDISERRRINVALQQARNKLNLLNAVTFQDIQTAAFSLSAYQELIKNVLSDPKARTYLEKQELFLKRMVSTLEFAKNYQEMGIHPARWQNVRQVFLYAISHLDFLSIQQDIRLNNLEIFADPLFEKALFNIMQNVLFHGVKSTEVRLSYSCNQDSLILFIEDNGVGIPVEEKNMIFDRGYGKGTGLGLFLVREVLSITGMTIRESGTPGQGTRFEIMVPNGTYRFPEPVPDLSTDS